MRNLSIDTMTTDSFEYLKLVRLELACFVFWPYHAEVPGVSIKFWLTLAQKSQKRLLIRNNRIGELSFIFLNL